jgi:hypothetical protein
MSNAAGFGNDFVADAEAGRMPEREQLASMIAFNEQLANDGVLLAAEGLRAPSKGTRLRFDGRGTTVIDGPFAETKELIAGFWIVQGKSHEEVVERFTHAPFERGEVIEIRLVIEPKDFGEATRTSPISRSAKTRGARCSLSTALGCAAADGAVCRCAATDRSRKRIALGKTEEPHDRCHHQGTSRCFLGRYIRGDHYYYGSATEDATEADVRRAPCDVADGSELSGKLLPYRHHVDQPPFPMEFREGSDAPIHILELRAHVRSLTRTLRDGVGRGNRHGIGPPCSCTRLSSSSST